jgi:hypothetical protein
MAQRAITAALRPGEPGPVVSARLGEHRGRRIDRDREEGEAPEADQRRALREPSGEISA